MYNFLKGRLLLVRVCLLAATFLLVVIGIVTLYAVGHPAEASPGPATGTESGPADSDKGDKTPKYHRSYGS